MNEGIAIQYELTKVYRGSTAPAVDNVSLDIPEGRIFGLLGPNGAGKTTTIRILCGLLASTSGEVTIGGFSLRHQLPSIRRIIGVVPQEIALYPSLTARENLTVFGGICGLRGSELKDRIGKWLRVFGLDKVNTRVGRYSGRMKRS
jgi:ABC-2 type transport system ATP-binding protein